VVKDSYGVTCTQFDPCPTVQQAVDLSVYGDEIKIHAGTYSENIFIETAGITLRGTSRANTILVAAGGREGAVGNANNPLNAVIEIRAPNVTLTKLAIIVPAGKATKRDAGVFAWPGSDNLSLTHCRVERLRDLRIDEPTAPGSRGIFVLLSRNSTVRNNRFTGNFEDHVHLPTGGVLVENNLVVGAARAGVSIMSPDFDPNFPSDKNTIAENRIFSSIDDGIHVQGDRNIITKNKIQNNGGYGVYLCGPQDDGCYHLTHVCGKSAPVTPPAAPNDLTNLRLECFIFSPYPFSYFIIPINF
jgi:parallel beta-helix repeat protein